MSKFDFFRYFDRDVHCFWCVIFLREQQTDIPNVVFIFLSASLSI
ncbi:hypothetical protein VCHENC02_1996, partial [Vibrio harveyi]